jgi:hypothetical protein
MPGSEKFRFEAREGLADRPTIFEFDSAEQMQKFLRSDLNLSKSDTEKLCANAAAIPSRIVSIDGDLSVNTETLKGLQRKTAQGALRMETT